MAEFRYGPVELYFVGFGEDGPSPQVMSALVDQLDSGLVRLLDFVLVARSAGGEVTIIEREDAAEDYLSGIELAAAGLTSDEDLADFATLLPAGSTGAVVALELVYARELASRLAASGGVVLGSERIPAPVVNAAMDALDPEGE